MLDEAKKLAEDNSGQALIQRMISGGGALVVLAIMFIIVAYVFDIGGGLDVIVNGTLSGPWDTFTSISGNALIMAVLAVLATFGFIALSVFIRRKR